MKSAIVILLAFALLAFGCTTTRQQAGAASIAAPSGNGTGNNSLAATPPETGGNSLPFAEEVAGFTQQGAGAQPEAVPEPPVLPPQENMNVPQSLPPQGGEPNIPSPLGVDPSMPMPVIPPENFTPAPPPPPPPPMPVSPLVPVPA